MTNSDYLLRPSCAADRDAVIQLVGDVYRDYGEQMCLENADADLLTTPDSYHHLGGEFVVLEHRGGIIGCHAAHPLEQEGVCTFRRLYLSSRHRGCGLGRQMMDWAVDWARRGSYQRIEFWSDTRFATAHAFFQRYGFSTRFETRTMHDGVEPYQEYFFWLALEPLDC